MGDVISEYQKWKQQGENLKVQAKEAMESRFRELLAEAVTIAEEYRRDFGAPLKPSSPVTAFRYKASGKPKAKAKQSGKLPPAVKPSPEPGLEAKVGKPNPKVARLQKQLAATRKKLEDAKGAGSPTRSLEDRVYEIEDALRLASS
jgi:hypothetical protein